MKLHRIYAVTLRFIYTLRHNLDRLVDMFYWPILDLLLWGVTSVYFAKANGGGSTIVIAVVSGIMFWLMFWRGQYETPINLLEDLWNKNLINMFGSPLKLSEWLISFVLLGIIKSLISFAFAGIIGFILYKVNILSFGLYLAPFVLLLLMSGWWVGLVVASIILRFGQRVQAFAWTIGWMMAPFVAVYYPVSALPIWAQKISMVFPMTYIFEGMRSVIYTGTVSWNLLLTSFALNIVYIAIAIYFIQSSFKVVLKRGLVKLI